MKPIPAAADAPRVLGVVLNYNGRDITLQTVEALLRSTYPALELVVVDNGSSDGSHEAVGERFPEVRRLRTAENLGISGGLNLGLRLGLDERFDYLMPMNNDIEVAPDMVTELVRLAGSDPRIGVVGPKCYYYFGDRNRIWSAGGVLRFRESVTGERGLGELDRGQFDRDQPVDYVNGAAMLIRRQALVAAGLWDPMYHVGVEDADFCARAVRAGYTCWYAHRARLWHMISPTTGGYVAGRTYRTGRSTAIFVRRFAGPAGWIGFLAASLAAFPVALLREALRRNAGAVLAKYRGFWAGLREPLPPPPGSGVEGPYTPRGEESPKGGS